MVNPKTLYRMARELGPARTCHTLAYRALQRAVSYKALVGVVTELSSLRYPDDVALPDGYEGRFLEPDEIRRIAADPALDMTEAFLDEALGRGDLCYGIVDGDTLANHCWYSSRPTPLSDDLVLHFDPSYLYVYKCLTLPAYRGQRLHGVGMTRAIRAMSERGYHGIIAYVETHNYSSLRSGAKMGHVEFGVIRVAHVRGRYFIHADRGCERYGFFVVPIARPAAAP